MTAGEWESDGKWYTTRLDDEQYSWLEQDLSRVPANTPVIVVSHVPILSAAVVAVIKSEGEQGYAIGGGSMHSDAAKIIA